ncbi:MAG TPA: hypothetical protein VLE22_19120, partial [Bryobacteraceae bacterium]|nr:hypothetical protein [Bryobacteraceae bacterium]
LILIALGSSVTVGTVRGQGISFLREFNNSEARGVAVDASGIYVAGGTGMSGFVRKFDLSGNHLWARVSGLGAAAIVASTGGVYVVGSDAAAGFIRKYDAEGNELWSRQTHNSIASAVAADATGVYVGDYDPAPRKDGSVRKYTADGEELWSHQLRGGPWPVGVAVDASGVYVVVRDSVKKYTADGKELWTRMFWQGGAWPVAVAVETTGIYVVGNTDTYPNPEQIVLVKYDSEGNELWIRQFDWLDVGGFVAPSGVAADATGVYIVGQTTRRLPDQCESSGQDVFVRKYGPNGVSLWSRRFLGSGDIGYASGVTVDTTGVYVVGSSVSNTWDGLRNSSRTNALLAKLEKTQPVIGESGPWIWPGCVVNAASYLGGRISPGEIVTVFGRRIGPPEATPPLHLTAGRRLATTLAGTRLLFNGIAAPLYFASANQISAIVPYAVADKPTADVEVEYQGVRSNKVTIPVAASRLGVFTSDRSGSGPAAALNEDGSINSSSNPAKQGSIIVLYATGEGLTEPVVEDGVVLGSVLPKPKLPVSVSFLAPGKPCDRHDYYSCYDSYFVTGRVLYAGGAPRSVAGLLQVNVRLPPDAYPDVGYTQVEFILCVGDRFVSGSLYIRR